jgi:polyisoprenoid-binding protein YceI
MATATTPTGKTTGATTWTVDPAHSSVEFAVKHLMISMVKGRFSDVKGWVQYDEEHPESAVLDIEIGIASIDTRNEQRDAHLKSPDFFDAEHHPVMSFKSRRIDGDPRATFKVTGDLSIRGVTRPVTLEGHFEGRNRDPWGADRLGFTASGKINRKDFGLNWNQALETGGWLVGDDIKLSIDVELVHKPE